MKWAQQTESGRCLLARRDRVVAISAVSRLRRCVETFDTDKRDWTEIRSSDISGTKFLARTVLQRVILFFFPRGPGEPMLARGHACNAVVLIIVLASAPLSDGTLFLAHALSSLSILPLSSDFEMSSLHFQIPIRGRLIMPAFVCTRTHTNHHTHCANTESVSHRINVLYKQ